MEILRFSHNAWGQEVLEGVAFDLAYVFAGAALAVIVIHMLYMWLRPRRRAAAPGA
jgi:hypothetical protein